MTKTKKKNPWLVLLMLLLICLLIWPTGTQIAYATETQTEETAYSNVLTDLKKDENFKQEDYPYTPTDNSLNVFQIAETTSQELLIYVYQPSQKFHATQISMSSSIGVNYNPKLYDLTLLDEDQTLQKYIVNDFVVKEDALRYYEIISIFRPFDKDIDEAPSDGNTINSVSYEVAKLFTASTVEGQVSYTCEFVQTIEITDKYVGFVRYEGSNIWWESSCDSHYVAFSTDKPIDDLIEAEVYFVTRLYKEDNFGKRYKADPVDHQVTIRHDQFADSEDFQGWFGQNVEWTRIQTVEEFKSENDDLTDETLNALVGKQWILRFHETSYTQSFVSIGGNTCEATEVTNVTILRLKFETDGQIYNLGVVDNQQQGDDDPDNFSSWFDQLKDWIKWLLRIVGIILLVVLLIVCFPVVVVILKGLWWLIKNIGKIIWYVISAPFKLFVDKGEK